MSARTSPGDSSTSIVPVSVVTVTYDSRPELDDWAAALEALDPAPVEVVVVDNASSDQSADFLEQWSERTRVSARVERSPDNLGFAGGMNRAIELTGAPYVLLLNPDARPRADFLARLLDGLEQARTARTKVAAVTPRLVRIEPEAKGSVGSRPPLLDACGMFLRPSWRHFDRGSEEVDRGQYQVREWVFGATGAASLFLREALDDTRLDGQILDEDFHTFREDAELCFRLQERGWSVLYEPSAVCWHRRSNTPARRRQMSSVVNRHTLKNRYLLRLYHQTAGNVVSTLLPAVGRDLAILIYVLLFERSSLSAYGWLWQHRKRIGARRRFLMKRRTVSAAQSNRWFFRRSEPI